MTTARTIKLRLTIIKDDELDPAQPPKVNLFDFLQVIFHQSLKF